jgi:hypothetical protein
VLVVHGTKKFLDHVGRPTAAPDEPSTTALGSWYATVLFWKPQVALFVNETTLLPVLMPFAPAITVLARFPAALERILAAHGVDPRFVDAELAAMADRRLARTANRSVIGTINEFSHLADAHRDQTTTLDLDALALWLAHTPCGALCTTHDFPDRALAAVVAGTTGRSIT